MGKSAFGTIRRLESGRYNARIRVRGRQINVGTFPTRRGAAAGIATAGGAVSGERAVDRTAGRQHLDVFAERWWATRIGHRPSTRARDRLILDHDLLPFMGKIPVGEVTAGDVQAWITALGTHLSPSSIRRAFTILDQLLDSAVDGGLIATNPAARVRLPRIDRPEMRFLIPTELEVLAETIDVPYKAMVLTMAWATLRIGEAAGLRRSDVEPLSASLRVANNVVEVGGHNHEGPPKTSAGRRTMTMPSSVMAELEDHLDRFASPTYVFPHPDGECLRAEEWRRRIWRPAVAAAGVDPSQIARRAGHASVAFTYDRYGHLLPEVDKQAGAKLEALRASAGRIGG